MTEIWKDIKGYEGKYQISSHGRVKALDYHRQGKQKLLKIKTDKDGYKVVGLRKDGKQITFKIHRLVGEAFLPNPNKLPQINHKDENKANNYIENLEWCTVEYNCNYGSRQTRFKGKNNPNYGKGVLSKDICVEIYNTRKILKITQVEMAEQLGISRTTVQKAEKIVKEMLVNGNI